MPGLLDSAVSVVGFSSRIRATSQNKFFDLQTISSNCLRDRQNRDRQNPNRQNPNRQDPNRQNLNRQNRSRKKKGNLETKGSWAHRLNR